MKGPFDNLDLGNWLYGLVAAVVGGGANAVVAGVAINIADPSHFNASTGPFYKIVGTVFAANATMSFFLYLKQTPLPKLVSKTVVTVEKTETPAESEKK